MIKSKISVSLLLLVLIYTLSACRYQPFIKYLFQNKDTNLPSFKKNDYFKGSKNELRTSYDLIKYDWYIKPDSKNKSIEGTMKIDFIAKRNNNTILLDLHKRLKIDDIQSDFPLDKYEHKGDLLYIYFKEPLKLEKKTQLSIQYHGKPVSIRKEGPIQWKNDNNGKDWISTQTEGIGAHYMMPCKIHLYDEPEACFIRVETDKDLVVVANGKLDSITEKPNSHIYHHSVHNPINIYNISFNIGDFVKLEKPYIDHEGMDRTIQIFPLAQDKDRADTFYNDLPLFMEHLESLFGPFPWWSDGCKFVQSTLGTSAMEHQSAISMGSIFYYDYVPPGKKHINTTVVHELAHEWWGNMITADDYADMWIHEGMATYAELLVIEKIYGMRYYLWSANMMKYYTDNHRPVIKTKDVLYNSWVSNRDQNIYYKGAMCMHTLRQQFGNDSLFLSVIRDASTHFALQNISTEQFEIYLNENLGEDFGWLFDIYLRNTEVPTISYFYDSVSSSLYFKWTSTLADQDKLKVFVRNEKEELIALSPNDEIQSIKVSKGELDLFDVGVNGYIIFDEKKKVDFLK